MGYTEIVMIYPTSKGMVMIKQLIMCILYITLLSACDTGGGNSSNVIVDNSTGETFVPIDLDVITDTTTGMIISGAIDHNTGEVDAFYIRADRGLDSYRNIEVETRNGYLLRLTHRTGLDEGTYPITLNLETLPTGNDIAGGLLYLWSPEDEQQFVNNPDGTLSIEYRGEDVLGAFMLTVENSEGGQVSIEGQFFTQESASAVR